MVQEYDFYIEHIAGKANIVADGFSRLLPLREEHLYLHDEFAPSEKDYQTIATTHNEVVGHHGIERTMEKLKAKGKHWKYMREHVKRYIRQCPCCQKMSYLRTPIHTHPFTTACYEPMEGWQADTIGPLPADEDGCCFILVIICCFTRWVSLYPIKDTTAKSCVDAMMQHVGTFGAPSQILTDNGTQFVNELVTELLEIIGVQHLTILP
jgi:transposase InsO family protein